jgi:hypothetical protein
MMVPTMNFLLASLTYMSKNERVLIMQYVGNQFCAACGDMSEPEKMPDGHGWQCMICSAQRLAPIVAPTQG